MDYETNGNLSLLENFSSPENTDGNKRNKSTSYEQLSDRREELKSSTFTVGLGPV
jgi:hypothetical protein